MQKYYNRPNVEPSTEYGFIYKNLYDIQIFYKDVNSA